MALENWTFRQNVHKHKGLLKALANLLTNEIQKRKGRSPVHLDFRFLLPLSQWLVEQAGYTITPQGNNPGNVMGKGDAGVFHRANNTEIVDGKPANVPADFAKYSSMEVGTAATFNHLKDRWFGAYTQMLDGGSAEQYVAGLYPGRGKNYATQFQNVYLSGIRLRLGKIIEDYIAVFEDDLKDLEKQKPVPMPLPNESLQDDFNDKIGRKKMEGISHSMNERRLLDVAPKIEEQREKEFQKQKSILEEQIKELKEIQKRFKEGKALQPGLPAQAAGN